MHLLKSKKAQATTEFLMTYGWAIFVILIVVGILIYYGFLNLRFVHEICVLTPLIYCEDYQVLEREIVIKVKNFYKDPLEQIKVTVKGSSDGGCTNSVGTTPGPIASEDTSLVYIYCNTPLTRQKPFKSDLSVEYTPQGKLTHTSQGILASTVQTKSLPTMPGWNILSLPAIPYDPDPTVVFEGHDICNGNLCKNVGAPGMVDFICYNCSDPSSFGNITTGVGYWWNCVASPCSLPYSGPFITSDLVIDLPALGWYSIGVNSKSVHVNQISFTKTDTSETKTFGEAANVWFQDPMMGKGPSGYYNVGLTVGSSRYLEPTHGYWIYTFVPNLEMTIPYLP